jgi:Rps23 Pro-64 3,4-dihydroxylase Tpa1-like proline 4-hydroxylase
MNMQGKTVIDLEAISRKFESAYPAYVSAEPFPHTTMQDVFNQEILKEIAKEFPTPEQMAGRFGGEIQGGKFTESDSSKFGPVTQAFVAACNSGPFLNALTKLTGIEHLLADPYLAGGGQHQTARGGRLKVHSDFNVHPFLNLTRQLNMIVYLNDAWDPSWGGALELWNEDMTEAVVTIPPALGQVAIFTCSDTSFHGLPDPIECPDHTYRRSIAFYYFTADGETPEPRSTLWKERPGEDFLTKPSARLRKSAGHIRQAFAALTGN